MKTMIRSFVLLLTFLPFSIKTVLAWQDSLPLISSDESIVSLFDAQRAANFAVIRLGDGNVEATISKRHTPLEGDACKITVSAGQRGLQLWLRANQVISDNTESISWWMFTRNFSNLNFDLVLESPEGKLLLYKARGRSDDFWSRSSWSFKDKDSPRKEIESLPDSETAHVGSVSGKWKFRGWLFWFTPFSRASFEWGELVFSPQKKDTSQLSWSLRDVALDRRWMGAYSGLNIAYEEVSARPSIPLGLLLYQHASPAHMSWQISTESGTIISNGTLPLPTKELRQKIRFSLPPLPPGNYWMRTKIFGANGELINHSLLSYLIHQNPERSISGAVDNGKADNSFAFDVFAPADGNPSFRGTASKLHDVTIKISSSLDADTVEWALNDGRGTTVSTGKTPLHSSSPLSLRSLLPELSGPQCYELTLQARKDGLLVDERIFPLYVETSDLPPPITARSRTPVHHGGFELKETDYRSLLGSQDEGFELFVSHAAQNASSIFLCSFWDDLEPAPDFFQFKLLDQRLAAAAKANVPVILTVYGHMDHMPRWLWYDQVLDQDGQNRHFVASYLRRFTATSTRTLDAYQNMIRRIVARYKDNDLVTGWNFSQGIESFWSDSSRNGFVVDYSASTEHAFGQKPPPPVFSKQLDLRPEWLRFEEFKQRTPREFFEKTFETIRSEDLHKPIYQYAVNGIGDPNTFFDLFKRHNATLSFGAGESTFSAFMESLCWQAGIPLDAESSGVPPQLPTLILSLYNKLAFGSWSEGMNVMWGRYFSPKHQAEIDGVSTIKTWFDTLNKMESSEPVSSGIAIGVGVRSLINHSRSFMWADWAVLNPYQFGDILVHSLASSSQTGYVTEKTPAEILARWPVIVFAEAPLLDEQESQKLRDYVHNGGKLVLQGDTGHYNYEGKETWGLKKSFGLSFDSDIPQSFGKGWVQWRKTPIIFKTTKDLATEHLAWTQATRPLEADNPQVWHALRRSADMQTYHVILLGKNWSGSSVHQSSAPNLRTILKLNSLPAGTRWILSDSASGQFLGDHTTQELKSGIPVSIKSMELRIIRISQATESPKANRTDARRADDDLSEKVTITKFAGPSGTFPNDFSKPGPQTDLVLNGNGAYRMTKGENVVSIYQGNHAGQLTDCKVATAFSLGGPVPHVGIVGRYVDANHFYMGRLLRAGQKWRLQIYKFNGGGDNDLELAGSATFDFPSSRTWHAGRLEFSMEGSHMHLKLYDEFTGGNLIKTLSASDSSLSRGSVGIRASTNNTPISFRDFSITTRK